MGAELRGNNRQEYPRGSGLDLSEVIQHGHGQQHRRVSPDRKIRGANVGHTWGR